jgi:hypothetical protein
MRRFVRKDPIEVAQWIWSKLDLPRGLTVPGWYHNYCGVSPWYTRARLSGRGNREKALAFIVRMNYILDSGLLTSKPGLPVAMTGVLQLFRLSYKDYLSLGVTNCTWRHSVFYNWAGALSCTLRVFFPLAFPLFGERFRHVSAGS